MGIYLLGNIIVVLCILSYVGSFLFCTISPFLHERKLKRLELTAELAILSEKLYGKQNLGEHRL